MPQHERRFTHALLLFLGFTSIFRPATGDGQAGLSEGQRADARQIASLRQEWVQDLHGKQLDPAMSLYTQDAVFYSPGGPPVNGLSAIRALFSTVMKTYDSDVQLNSTGLAVSGDLAYDSGDYDETLTLRTTRTKSVLHGSYLMVLQRGKDQHWRIRQHMWTQVAPAK